MSHHEALLACYQRPHKRRARPSAGTCGGELCDKGDFVAPPPCLRAMAYQRFSSLDAFFGGQGANTSGPISYSCGLFAWLIGVLALGMLGSRRDTGAPAEGAGLVAGGMARCRGQRDDLSKALVMAWPGPKLCRTTS